MPLTNDELQQILNALKESSNDVSELESVDSLDGIVSLPAMKGEVLVNAPLSLLRKPAEDAAKTANSAATAANSAATTANTAAQGAQESAGFAESKATEAQTAAVDANNAASEARNVVALYEGTALAARDGATARFDAMVDEATVLDTVANLPTGNGRIVYVRSTKVFAYELDGRYHVNAFNGRIYLLDMFMKDGKVLPDKIYLCGNAMYVWSELES